MMQLNKDALRLLKVIALEQLERRLYFARDHVFIFTPSQASRANQSTCEATLPGKEAPMSRRVASAARPNFDRLHKCVFSDEDAATPPPSVYADLV